MAKALAECKVHGLQVPVAGLAHVENARWFRIPKKSVEWTGSALSSWRSPPPQVIRL